MKIEWLNEDMTEAVVTRGIFRKRCAKLFLGSIRIDYEFSSGSYSEAAWKFVSTKNYVGDSVSGKLIRARKLALEKRRLDSLVGKEWVPVGCLPKATVIK